MKNSHTPKKYKLKTSRKIRSSKAHLKSFIHSLKHLTLSKRFLLFFSLFIVLNLFFFSEYLKVLISFSLTANIFSLIDPQTIHPVTLLSSQFDCAIAQCNISSRIFLVLLLSLEGFAIISFIKPLMKISKKFLIFYGIILQFLLIIPLLARTLGEVGNLAEGEQRAVVGALPDEFSTQEEAVGGFNDMRLALGIKSKVRQ